MSLLAIDLGGTKLAIAVFTKNGEFLYSEKIMLDKRTGSQVGRLITDQINKILSEEHSIQSIGISIPGIYNAKEGTAWVPNIPGWEDYPLLNEVKTVVGNIPVVIDSDRACYIMGEWWKGSAQNCTDAIYLAVGTGIGAGILADGKILRGANNIAGSIGWMALQHPFDIEYTQCGCFETKASGEGIAKVLKKMVLEKEDYNGLLKNKLQSLTATDVFTAHDLGDPVATEVIHHCIELWGMAIANLVSLFNPQKIILGGGVFGPAVKLIPVIYEEAKKWAQPVSIREVVIEPTALGADAGLYGAAYIAKEMKLKSMHE